LDGDASFGAGGDSSRIEERGDVLAVDGDIQYAAPFSCDQVVMPKPSGWWRFDEIAGSSVIDSSGNDNHGTVMAGDKAFNEAIRTTGRSGYAQNRALKLDGVREWVRIDPSPTLDLIPNDGVTISAWVNLSERTIASATAVNIVHRHFESNGLYFLGVRNGVPRAGIKFFYASGGRLVSDRWTHLGFTYDGIDEALYVDGQLVATSASGLPGASIRAPISIGAKVDFFDGSIVGAMDGLIDDVAIFPRGLTPAQVMFLARGCL